MIPTPMQVFLAVADFLLFIVLGVCFVQNMATLAKLRQNRKMMEETRRLVEGADAERQRWIAQKFGVKEKR
jgi:hypothetical protein